MKLDTFRVSFSLTPREKKSWITAQNPKKTKLQVPSHLYNDWLCLIAEAAKLEKAENLFMVVALCHWSSLLASQSTSLKSIPQSGNLILPRPVIGKLIEQIRKHQHSDTYTHTQRELEPNRARDFCEAATRSPARADFHFSFYHAAAVIFFTLQFHLKKPGWR